jgi:uncharacterized protein YbaR (Trm112 family)
LAEPIRNRREGLLQMRLETLEILRCPYCGGRLELVESLFHRRTGDDVLDGILGCHCCTFPVVDGIPVLHLRPNATAARDHVQADQPELARRTMIGLEDVHEAEAFDAIASSSTATYRETVEALGPRFPSGYFVYRFSDPTYIVAQAVVRSIARTVLHGERRAIDICGGSGHLTRSLMDLSSPPTILVDLFYVKLLLARKFVAPGCEPVCCDGNAPLPFARGTFGFAMCTDAFMFIWTKRQFVGEMERLVATGGESGAVLIGHTHNKRTWSPSHGEPLSVEGYRDLFESFEPRVFGEAGLFPEVVNGGPLDLSRRDPDAVLDPDPALSIIASQHPGVFATHQLDALPLPVATGEFRLNPLYAVTPNSDSVRLHLQFPSRDYAEEYGACRVYLPDEVVVDRAVLASLPASTVTGELADLARRRIVLDLPKGYY